MWRHVSYYQKGISHRLNGLKCQDSVTIHEDEHCIVAAVADGLGSLRYSELASRAATVMACQWLSSADPRKLFLKEPEREALFREEFLTAVKDSVLKAAAENEVAAEDMDCTLAFVYISKKHDFALSGLVGDSAICVIQKDDAIAITDSNASANGTIAVLDAIAGSSMLLRNWNLKSDRIQGFVLTSDGLDGEVYVKGSKHINKIAEQYFNVLLEDDPLAELKRNIEEITNDEESFFDDDISIAVISRAEEPVVLADDPSWLCTCGCRNRLQDTYCVECDKDFTVLYRGVPFGQYGGKNAFFRTINRNPQEERRLIGLQPCEADPVQELPAAKKPDPEEMPPAEDASLPAEDESVQVNQTPQSEPEASVAVDPVQGRLAQLMPDQTKQEPAEEPAAVMSVESKRPAKKKKGGFWWIGLGGLAIGLLFGVVLMKFALPNRGNDLPPGELDFPPVIETTASDDGIVPEETTEADDGIVPEETEEPVEYTDPDEMTETDATAEPEEDQKSEPFDGDDECDEDPEEEDSSAPEQEYIYWVISSTLNVREEPSAKSNRVESLVAGTKMTGTGVTRESNGSIWIEIDSPVRGWVNGNYVISGQLEDSGG